MKTSLGATTFASTYRTNADKSNAFGKCVSRWTQAEHKNRLAAETACKAEQADAGFAAAHGGKTFDQFYGTGKKGANALNRCIQDKTAATRAAQKAGRRERIALVQGRAHGHGRDRLQGQVRHERGQVECVRQVRGEARRRKELEAR